MIAPSHDSSFRARSALLGVGRARLAQRAQATAALLAKALLVAVVAVTAAHAHAALAGGAVNHHVGDADRHLLRETAALLVVAVGLQVLVHPVDTLDDDLARLGDH